MSNFLNKYKSVYDVFLDNWSYQSHYVLYLEALMRQQTLLPTYIKEMIFAYISGLNGCQYCKNIHAEISKKLLRDANDEQPLLDIENAGIEEKYKPILKLAHKVNVDIKSIVDEDVDQILQYGFDERVISEIISICGAAQFMNTVVVAHQIKPLDDIQNIGSAKMMIEKGYDGLAEYMISKRNK
tara:strand:+ start:281 stop:832 length:552 start_codon:yes stop_codon:yes gene_type:complete